MELKQRQIKRYGWKPDIPDHRDLLLEPEVESTHLPTSADLRPGMPPVVDQGQLGSCTANAIAAALAYDQIKQKETFTPFSRLFIYYNERVIENSVSSDSGAQIRDGIKSVAQAGAAQESEWPYDITKFADRPTDQVYADAVKFKALLYQRVVHSNTNATPLKTALAKNFPVVIGFSVYDSFESDAVAKTGVVPMPSSSESLLGGHAVLVVGYDDSKQLFTVRNSWGEGWGDKGYFYLPYQYLMTPGLASDFWTITSVS